MLPASKVIPKELLPIIDTPAIQIAVEEAVRSGVSEIVMVLAPGRTLALDHFHPAAELEHLLESRGKREVLESVRHTSRLARFIQVEQKEPLGLGHALLQARDAIGDEPFGVFYPDDIVDAEKPLLAQIIDAAQALDAPVLSLMRVARSELSKYGIVEAAKTGERTYHLTGMVEKPAPEKAPSELAIIGRHVLTPDIFEILSHTQPGAGGEIQLTDAILELARKRRVYGYEFEGVRYDLGDRLGFVTAQIGYGLKRADIGDGLRAFLKTIIPH